MIIWGLPLRTSSRSHESHLSQNIICPVTYKYGFVQWFWTNLNKSAYFKTKYIWICRRITDDIFKYFFSKRKCIVDNCSFIQIFMQYCNMGYQQLFIIGIIDHNSVTYVDITLSSIYTRSCRIKTNINWILNVLKALKFNIPCIILLIDERIHYSSPAKKQVVHLLHESHLIFHGLI